jgi:O-antigen/teichoic acid export membrane protein
VAGKSSARRLGAGTAAGILGMGAGYAAQFIFSIGIARTLGPEAGGVFFGMHAAAFFAALVARLGLDRLSLRDIAALDEKGQTSSAVRLATRRAVIVALAGTVLAALVAGANQVLDIFSDGIQHQRALWTILSAAPFLAVSILSASFLRALEKVLLAAGAQLLIIYGGGALILFGFPGVFAENLDRVAGVFLCLCVFSSIAGLVAFRRVAGARSDSGGPIELQSDWRTPAHMLAVAVMTYFVSGADIMLLAILASPEQVTLYVAASRSVLGVSLGLVGINSIAGSLLSRAYQRQDFSEMRQICRSSASWGAYSALLSGFLLLGIAPVIFDLFRVDQVAGIFLFLLLWGGQMANSSVGPVVLVAQMSENERVVTGVLLISALAACIGYLLLIPIFGAPGAAVSSSAALIGWNTGLALRLRRRLQIQTWPRRLPGVAALWMGTALLFGSTASLEIWWWRLPLVLLLVLLATFLVLDAAERSMMSTILRGLVRARS